MKRQTYCDFSYESPGNNNMPGATVTICQHCANGTSLDSSLRGPRKIIRDRNDNKFKNYRIMIRPLADRVVIEPKEAETKTASGLYIPDTAKEKPQQGVVLACGPGKTDEPMEVKTGDVVLYGKYAGTEVTVDEKKLLIVRQSDILAIL